MSKKTKAKGEYAIVLAVGLYPILCRCHTDKGGWLHLSEGLELYDGARAWLEDLIKWASRGPEYKGLHAEGRTPRMRLRTEPLMAVVPVDEEVWVPYAKKWGKSVDTRKAKAKKPA